MARKTKAQNRYEKARAWAESPTGLAAYQAERAEAQKKADLVGHDVGIELNDIFLEWNSFLLPAAQYRQGHELRCEVVHPQVVTQPGYGPEATRAAVSKVLTPRYV